jgi:hypothetical protein
VAGEVVGCADILLSTSGGKFRDIFLKKKFSRNFRRSSSVLYNMNVESQNKEHFYFSFANMISYM